MFVHAICYDVLRNVLHAVHCVLRVSTVIADVARTEEVTTRKLNRAVSY